MLKILRLYQMSVPNFCCCLIHKPQMSGVDRSIFSSKFLNSVPESAGIAFPSFNSVTASSVMFCVPCLYLAENHNYGSQLGCMELISLPKIKPAPQPLVVGYKKVGPMQIVRPPPAKLDIFSPLHHHVNYNFVTCKPPC